MSEESDESQGWQDWSASCLQQSFMSEEAERLKERTMRFALDVCELIEQLPPYEPGPTVRRQLAKAATSVAFNYRSSCRGRSHAEFTSKIGVVAEESDETQGWLEFIDAGRLIRSAELLRLLREAGELASSNPYHPITQSNYSITRSLDYPIHSSQVG